MSESTVSLREYLETSYRPDREYIDGQLRERNLGEVDHSRIQMLLASYLFSREKSWGIVVLPEQRVQVRPTRYRVPDISVVKGALPSTPILREPPFLCIEILSRDDTLSELKERVDDYLVFGVPHVWVVDPPKSRAFHYTRYGMKEATDGMLRTNDPAILVPVFQLENL